VAPSPDGDRQRLLHILERKRELLKVWWLVVAIICLQYACPTCFSLSS
jgi:hypothetical protein